MDKNKIIEYLYSINAVRMYGCVYLKKFNKTQEDLVGQVWLNICELPDDILIELWNQGEKNLTAYIKKFVTNQLSPTGRTRDLQRLFTTEVPVDIEDEVTGEDEREEYNGKKYDIETDIDAKITEYMKQNNYEEGF